MTTTEVKELDKTTEIVTRFTSGTGFELYSSVRNIPKESKQQAALERQEDETS